ncbi:helicase-exonuclease AddAB subunit AddA [Streptococcus suis]|uniref:helicase-exonuclease AddAB subunit AddA n=2 Tax=Streptococcus suis TaxID=1307 RepID=UPI000CF4DCAA|nr:helicase-exonuclease AddAB subunit AddA [Streptococcus suis]
MSFQAFLTEEEIKEIQAQELASEKDQKRTPEQIEAIYSHGQNILVSASAGSGKTFVMVERILDKLKRGVHIDQLFISTFTVKAAGELKERIEKRLNTEIKETVDEDIRRHLTAQLAELGNADIGTMDSFTQKLVTIYGYELGVAPNFRIMTDKNEQDLLKNEVFGDLFADYLSGKDGKSFEQLVRNFSGNRKDNKNFRELVYQIYDFSQATSAPDKWLRQNLLKGYQVYKDWESLPSSSLTGLLAAMLQAADDLQDLTDLPDYKQKTAKGEDTAAYKKHQLIFQSLREWAQEFDRNMDAARLLELTGKLVDILPSSSDVTVAGVKHPIFKQLKSHLQNLQFLETIFAYQPHVLPLMRILQEFVCDFSYQYLQAKMQENAFEFSDISHLAIGILESNAQIRQHFQEKYHEVMVDEYQDNNHTQERMLDLLSNGHNRFMVGDIKQSIYRFRQADPQIFQDKFELYQANPEAGKLILLKENFRSRVEVIDATNAIFTRLMDKEVGQIKYDETHSLVAGSEEQGKQELILPNNEMEYLIYNTDISDEEQEEQSFTAGEVELVAKEIIRLHKQEGVAFSKITLLVPSRTRNDAILTSFEKHGIPLVADGGMASYLKSLEVMVMLDTLRTINQPLNDYALVALLKSPMFAFDEDQLARLALQSESGFFYDKIQLALSGQSENADLIEQDLLEKVQKFDAVLSDWRKFAKLHSIHDLIWKIFNDRFYYDYVGALPNGQKRQANLYALGLRANQFEKTGFKGLSRFISMIDKVLASDNDLAEVEVAVPKDAVQLMTVHKSKGLEFQYVFLMNMDKKFNAMESRAPYILSRENGLGIQFIADMKDQFDTPLLHVRVQMDTLPYQINGQELKIANLSEQMRLLYVAMTRAEKKLYLVGKGSQEKLATRYDGKRQDGVLARASRESMTSFQDWVLAIEAAFPDQDLHFKKRFIQDTDLVFTDEDKLEMPDKQTNPGGKDQRQSKAISDTIKQLKGVEELNKRYKPAIDLPTLRTPSQIKKLYEPVLSDEALDVIEPRQTEHSFSLPNFTKHKQVTGADMGSAIHELMQAIDLSWLVTEDTVKEALARVQADQAVKDRIDTQKILDFFDTDLGREILSNTDKLHREAPFASIQKDATSKEEFVLRGIIDGYILYEDHIVLFDYKTDKYKHPEQLRERYRQQMALYAASLRQAYAIDRVDSYLILLGGNQIEVLSL